MARALPPRGFEADDSEKRLQWLEDKTGVRLDGAGTDEPADLQGIIENHIGSVNIPMAVAGPLVLDGAYAVGEYYIPLCTLEATLSMSMSRGLYLTSLSGGIKARHMKQEVSRSPVFIFDDIEDAPHFKEWLENNFDLIRQGDPGLRLLYGGGGGPEHGDDRYPGGLPLHRCSLWPPEEVPLLHRV